MSKHRLWQKNNFNVLVEEWMPFIVVGVKNYCLKAI